MTTRFGAWSPQEDETLRAACADLTVSYKHMLLLLPGRTIVAMQSRVKLLGIQNLVSDDLKAPNAPIIWSPERDALVRQLIVVEGKSLRQAVPVLGGSHGSLQRRMKVLGIETAPVTPLVQKPAKASAPPILRVSVEDFRRAPQAVSGGRAPEGLPTLRDLERGDCRFPIGDARDEVDGEQRFCGSPYTPHADLRDYCEKHRELSVAAHERARYHARVAKLRRQQVAA